MPVTIAVISAGQMGAGIGARLTERGADVLTWLDGRSAATAERAAVAGMRMADPATVSAADVILSIVPPRDALTLAERLAPSLSAAETKPLYVDCNAVSPQTAARIAAVIAGTGTPFVDGGIIGGPPSPGKRAPALYVSGPEAGRAVALREHGLDIRLLDGPVGAASALKMSYAGITKGFTALGTVMALAASRQGAAEALRSELADSQPELLRWLDRQVPMMYPKAYRWVAEMEEIAAFIDVPGQDSQMLEGAARLYERLAAELGTEHSETRPLDRFFADDARARKSAARIKGR